MSDEYRSYDSGPEDSWHPLDHVDVLLDNLSRRCDLLGEPRRAPSDASRDQLLADLRQRVARLRRRDVELSDIDEVRFDLLVEDINTVANRLHAGRIAGLHGNPQYDRAG